MLPAFPFTFADHPDLAIAAALGLTAILIAALRRVDLSPSARACFLAGLLCLILAAGRPYYLVPSPRHVAVMIDLSPSTRGALFRNLAPLRARIAQLLPATPYQVFFFADANHLGSLTSDSPLPDIPAAKTQFAPAPADAILLFSDGQFPLPSHAPPTYPVLDPLLEQTSDAAITAMDLVNNQIAISITNNGPPRLLTTHTPAATIHPVQGSQTLVVPNADQLWAQLSPGDLWPENDTLSIRPTPPPNSQRWWIGPSPPINWRAIAPADLPTDPAQYLTPAVIVLNNTAAEQFPPLALDRLSQYVRDLGGSLIICGGDHAYSSGNYQGTPLESLSPLSSSPPQAAVSWIILTDASGSMSQLETPAITRWDLASRAIIQLLPQLPPADTVRIGQFSDSLRWWSQGLTARQTAQLPLPPPNALPRGPTNLEPVLNALAMPATKNVTNLLLLTDAQTAIDRPALLANKLISANIRLYLLAVARGQGVAALQDIARDTHGGFLTQLRPNEWAASIRALLQGALPQRLHSQPIALHFLPPASAIPGGVFSPWNSTWPKPAATPLAQDGTSRTFAAAWRFGAGQVAALSFQPTTLQAAALADLFAQPPRDPRLKVIWQTTPILHVSIDAIENNHYLNGLNLTLQLWDQNSPPAPPQIIPQTAPGRYELALPAPGQPAIATVRQSGRPVDRAALPACYPLEFSAIGENRPALDSLAAQTGGQIIPPAQTTPIQFPWPPQQRPLAPLLAALAAAFISAALIAWKREAAR